MDAVLQSSEAPPAARRKTSSLVLIVHSGDFDRLMAAFILATTAAAIGQPVTMFFNFWGLLGLRAQRRLKGKPWLDRMLSIALPRGFDRVSRMNLLGFGSRFFRYVMRRKSVTGLAQLQAEASALGVRMIACSTSMEVMGIQADELVPGVEVGGAILCVQEFTDPGSTTLFV